MFSKTCEYAIRAMIFIAQKTQDGSRVGIKAIAQAIDSPEYFIAKILQDLVRRGFVQSAKGPTGGFYLDEKSRKLSIAEIVIAVDGNRLFNRCGLGLKHCSEARPCPIHFQFKKVKEELIELLESSKIGSFSDALENRLTFLKR